MGTRIGFLFPAFGAGYGGGRSGLFPGYEEELDRLLPRASAVVEIDRRRFDEPANDLQAHYVCFINSCLIADALTRRGITCDYVAPYSMGLFSALYHTSSYTFEDGLLLTHNICSFAIEAADGDEYGMAVVIGLTAGEVTELITDHCENVELADQSNEHVAIASGRREELQRLLELAEEKGCLHGKMMPLELPYHSSFLQRTEARIRDYLADLEIRQPSCGIVSCTDQKILTTADEVRREVAINISRNINWFKTMKTMFQLGVGLFVECGAGDTLSKQARFFQGDFQAFHPRRFQKLFELLEQGEGSR